MLSWLHSLRFGLFVQAILSSCRYFDAFTFSFVPRVLSLRVEVTAVVALLFLVVPVCTVPMPASFEEVLYSIVGPSQSVVPKPFFLLVIRFGFRLRMSRFISGKICQFSNFEMGRVFLFHISVSVHSEVITF